jgi:hypothetical protein
MRSTPVVGGGLFNEGASDKDSDDTGDAFKGSKKGTGGGKGSVFSLKPSGHPAELIVEGEVYKIRISDETLRNLRQGYSGEMLDSRGISVGSGMSIQHDDVPVVSRLQGYIRNAGPLGRISEEHDEGVSDTSSDRHHSAKPGDKV